jgi:hypothetical protein
MLPNQATNAEVIREPPRPTHTGGPDCAGRRVFEWSGAGRPAGHGARVALRVGHRQGIGPRWNAIASMVQSQCDSAWENAAHVPGSDTYRLMVTAEFHRNTT